MRELLIYSAHEQIVGRCGLDRIGDVEQTRRDFMRNITV